MIHGKRPTMKKDDYFRLIGHEDDVSPMIIESRGSVDSIIEKLCNLRNLILDVLGEKVYELENECQSFF